MLPDALLKDYADKFYGFGTWAAKIWFIGIEEAGGSKEEDVQKRLDAWDQGGRLELENAPDFYRASGQYNWHGADAKPQATWKQLIRLLLVARGRTVVDDEAVLNYQRNHFARVDGRECLAELLPLPSPNATMWNYHNWSELSWLRSRSLYQNFVLLERSASILRKIQEHHPKVIIFYSSTWHRLWAEIARGVWIQAIKGKLMCIDREGMSFYVTRHPRAESDEYFRRIGEFLNQKHGNRH